DRDRRAERASSSRVHHGGDEPRHREGDLGEAGPECGDGASILRRAGRGARGEARARHARPVCVVHRGGEEGGSAGTARLGPLPRAAARTRRSRPGPPGAGARAEGDGGGNLVEEDTLRVAEKPLEPRAVGEAEARRGEADEPATV